MPSGAMISVESSTISVSTGASGLSFSPHPSSGSLGKKSSAFDPFWIPARLPVESYKVPSASSPLFARLPTIHIDRGTTQRRRQAAAATASTRQGFFLGGFSGCRVRSYKGGIIVVCAGSLGAALATWDAGAAAPSRKASPLARISSSMQDRASKSKSCFFSLTFFTA